MNKKINLLIIALFAITGIGIVNALESGTMPTDFVTVLPDVSISISNENIDVGTLHPGDSIQLPIKINNTGTVNAIVTLTNSGLKDNNSNVLPPIIFSQNNINISNGNSQIVNATLSVPYGVVDGSYSGKINITATNGNLTTNATINVKATVFTEKIGTLVTPVNINFGKLKHGTSSTIPITIENPGNVNINVTLKDNGMIGTITGYRLPSIVFSQNNVPIPDSGIFIEVGSKQTVYATLNVPDGTPKDTYSGTISILASRAP